MYTPLTLPTMLGFDYYTSLCLLCLLCLLCSLCLLCLLCSTVMVVSVDSLFFYLKGLRLQSGVYLRASLTLPLRRVAGAVKALGGAPGGRAQAQGERSGGVGGKARRGRGKGADEGAVLIRFLFLFCTAVSGFLVCAGLAVLVISTMVKLKHCMV